MHGFCNFNLLKVTSTLDLDTLDNIFASNGRVNNYYNNLLDSRVVFYIIQDIKVTLTQDFL